MVTLLIHEDGTWQQVIDRRLTIVEQAAVRAGLDEAIRFEGNRFQQLRKGDGDNLTWEPIQEVK